MKRAEYNRAPPALDTLYERVLQRVRSGKPARRLPATEIAQALGITVGGLWMFEQAIFQRLRRRQVTCRALREAAADCRNVRRYPINPPKLSSQ